MMNKNGYLVFEMVVSFAIAFVIAVALLGVTYELKARNDTLFLETILLTDKALITREIEKDVLRKDITNIDMTCNDVSPVVLCVDITYNGYELKRLTIDIANINDATLRYGLFDEESNTYQLGTYEKKLQSNLIYDQEKMKAETKTIGDVREDAIYNSFLIIRVPIRHEYSERDFGLNIITVYNTRNLQ